MTTINQNLPKSHSKITSIKPADENTNESRLETTVIEGTWPTVVHKLEGTLPDPINMAPLNISGNIDAVGNFLTLRKSVITPETAYIQIDRVAKTVILIVDEKHPHKTTVTGKVLINPDLAKFGINQDKRYSPAELAETIKLNRYFFKSHEQHQQLLKNLKNINADISHKLKESNDDRGNLEKSLTTKLQSDIDEKFTLDMPLFRGGLEKKVSFEVNICMEVRNAGISIWLISVELQELTVARTEELFNAKVEEYKPFGIVVIEQ